MMKFTPPAADPCQNVSAELRRRTQQLHHAVCFLQEKTVHQGAGSSLCKENTAGKGITAVIPNHCADTLVCHESSSGLTLKSIQFHLLFLETIIFISPLNQFLKIVHNRSVVQSRVRRMALFRLSVDLIFIRFDFASSKRLLQF